MIQGTISVLDPRKEQGASIGRRTILTVYTVQMVSIVIIKYNPLTGNDFRRLDSLGKCQGLHHHSLDEAPSTKSENCLQRAGVLYRLVDETIPVT